MTTKACTGLGPRRRPWPRRCPGVDGCAIFYKASKWILLEKHLIDYANIAINRPDMKNHHDIFNRVMPKDNIEDHLSLREPVYRRAAHSRGHASGMGAESRRCKAGADCHSDGARHKVFREMDTGSAPEGEGEEDDSATG